MTDVLRVPIQSRELEAAVTEHTDGVLRRAGDALLAVMAGKTVILEERIASFSDEDIIEETVLEAHAPS